MACDQLAATVKTFGVARTFNLVDAKLTDVGGTVTSTIDSGDLTLVNNKLSGTGNSAWYGSQTKDGTGAINFARIGGMVGVNTAASLSITAGSGTGTAKLVLNGAGTLGTSEVTLDKKGVVVFTASTADSVRTAIAGGKLIKPTAGTADLTIGYLTGAQYNALHIGNSLGLADANVIAQYTWTGDTTLKGYIDASDFAQLDASYLKHIYDGSGASWIKGDFTNDSKIDASDFAAINAAYSTSHGLPLAADPFLVGSAAMLGMSVADFSSLVAGQMNAVPEPASLTLLGLGAVALLRRRR